MSQLRIPGASARSFFPSSTSRPKSGAGRLVSLAPEAVQALRTWRAKQLEDRLAWGEAWQDTGHVFTRSDGSVVHPDSITSEFRRVQSRLDLPRIRLHDARHTWATLALKMGVPLKIVSANLGHSSITVTADIYSHVTPTMAADATAQIASSIFSAT